MNEPSIHSETTDLSVMIERAVSMALAKQSEQSKQSEQLEPGKLSGVSTGESSAGKPSTAAQGLLEGVSTPSIEEIVACEVRRAVEKALKGESLPKYTAASEQALGETQPQSRPDHKTVTGLEPASGETQPKYNLEAQNETRAVEKAKGETRPKYTESAQEETAERGLFRLGETPRECSSRKRKRRDSSESLSSEGDLVAETALSGLRVLNPREWASLDDVGRAAMALNVDTHYGVVHRDGSAHLQKETASLTRILQAVITSIGKLRTPTEFDSFASQIGELTIGRLQVVRTGVTHGWDAADAYDAALFAAKGAPTFLRRGEEAAIKASKKTKKAAQPTRSASTGRHTSGGPRWGKNKKAHRNDRNKQGDNKKEEY